MEQELYKKYRPQTLNEIVGNRDIVLSLKASLENGELPHTILLSGPSGCGKTTIARILKTELGCSDGDFEEFNCSDRNGVDFGREIISRMKYKPMNGKVRIFLLDECHQMSTACANVLLKPLEDTPKHVYFILSTSEPEKLISAMKTRSSHYQVKSLKEKELSKLIDTVANKEGMEISEDTKEQIIDNANGSARMALVFLEQIRNMKGDDVSDVIKSATEEKSASIELCRALVNARPWREVAGILSKLGDDPEGVRRCVLGYASKVLLSANPKSSGQAFLVLQCFKDSFFYTGKAGLIMASYDAITDGGNR